MLFPHDNYIKCAVNQNERYNKSIKKICRSWILSSYMEKKKTKFAIYLSCVSRAVIALTTSTHYLDVRTPEDIIYNMILSVLGLLGFIYMLSTFVLFN